MQPGQPPSLDGTQRIWNKIGELERFVRSVGALVNGGAVGQLPVVDSLPAAGRKGRAVILAGDGHVYRDTGAAWVDVG